MTEVEGWAQWGARQPLTMYMDAPRTPDSLAFCLPAALRLLECRVRPIRGRSNGRGIYEQHHLYRWTGRRHSCRSVFFRAGVADDYRRFKQTTAGRSLHVMQQSADVREGRPTPRRGAGDALRAPRRAASRPGSLDGAYDFLPCSAFAASIAVFTSRFSSGGGSTALRPSDFSHSSRHQPLVWYRCSSSSSSTSS